MHDLMQTISVVHQQRQPWHWFVVLTALTCTPAWESTVPSAGWKQEHKSMASPPRREQRLQRMDLRLWPRQQRAAPTSTEDSKVTLAPFLVLLKALYLSMGVPNKPWFRSAPC